PVRPEARGARAEAGGVRAERLLAAQVGRPLQGGDGLGALQVLGAVDAPVADEDDVVIAGDPARLREVHVGDARAAFEPEDRRAGMGGERLDASDRESDQPRTGLGPVLGDDEGAAVGGVAALLRAVPARMQGQLAGPRTGGDGPDGAPAGDTY